MEMLRQPHQALPAPNEHPWFQNCHNPTRMLHALYDNTLLNWRPHLSRSQTPVSESNYDNTSAADSVADSNSISNGRIKRTEAERKQYFENEPECSSIEAHCALCTRCKKWVRLSTRQTYSVRPWEMHRQRCDQKLPV